MCWGLGKVPTLNGMEQAQHWGSSFKARLCRRREWESGSLHGEGPSSKDTGCLLRGEGGQALGPHGECDGGRELILGSRAAITKATEWAA